MPEEVNRVVTDQVGHFLFAPSPDAVEHLRRRASRRPHPPRGQRHDRHPPGQPRPGPVPPGARRPRPRARELRGRHPAPPANVDEPGALKGLLDALGEIAAVPTGLPGAPPDRPAVRPRPRSRPAARRRPRLPRLPGARVVGPDRAHRLRRRAGGDHGARRPLPHPAGHHRAPDHGDGGDQHRGGQRPRPDRRRGPARADRGVPRRPALWDGRAAERIADVLVS